MKGAAFHDSSGGQARRVGGAEVSQPVCFSSFRTNLFTQLP